MLSTDRQKGFSLIELMIVVVIIGILSAVAIPAYFHYIVSTRQTDAVQTLMQIKSAQERYYALKDSYANTIGNLDGFTSAGATWSDSKNIYTYSISAATATTFTALAQGDPNQDGNATDCWQITGSTSEPTQIPCAPPNATFDEGFKFSLVSRIL